MKKILALILAILMVSSLAVTLVSAEAETDWEAVAKSLGLNIYVGKPVETAPVIDGAIGDGEYTATKTTAVDKLSAGAASEVQGEEVVEYFAHDAEYIYYGIVFTQTADNRACWPQMLVTNTFNVYVDAAGTINDYHNGRATFQIRYLEDGSTKNNGIAGPSGGTAPVFEEDVWFKATKDENNVKTYEFKFAKAYIAENSNCEVADVRVLPMWTFFHASTSTAHVLTADDMAVLAEAGVGTIRDFGEGKNMYNFVVLDEAPVDLGKWGNLAEELGMNVHAPAAEVSPVLDGVINEGEYTAILHNAKEDIKNYGNYIKDDNGLTEYFAHDADYIYYAVSYANEVGQHAFMWQFKPFNSFDIYNPSGANDYYHNRLSGQARYNTGYADRYRYWNTDYTGSWAHVFTHATSVRAPYMHKTMVAGSFEEYHCAGGINNGISVFEAKIAKSYIAEINNCEIADVKVVPYFTFLHSADNVGVLMTAEKVAALKAAGAEFTPNAGDIAYRFIVLDGTSTAGVQDYIAAATKSTASVRISEQNPGLRFKTTVNTGDLNMLIDKVGVENVKVGTLIAPADKVGAKALTHAFGEAGVDYLDVVADVTDPFGTEGYKTVFAGSIANIKAANLNRDFTAVGYIAYFDGEAWNYSYSTTAAEKNVSDVAYAAYTDIAFEEAAGYTNEIVGAGDTLKGAYSPYTEVQRAVLRALIVEINIKDNFGGDIFAD